MYCDKPTVNPSRLFIYYNERVIAGDVADDSGACLADGIKASPATCFFSAYFWYRGILWPSSQALQTYGACDEADYPYHDDKVSSLGVVERSDVDVDKPVFRLCCACIL